ncbi:MAG: SsrA-binding protein SmpB [Desulfomonile tiedjei]|uniref:SsrA-binding protein n=1 Tax=Desulfomonile tiedjei TaxID=2358 RepID=A0A9D6Z4P0_9BACT|nr:SsrA-binding protein SmpB [Desulfomonile tiedjei]
MKQTDGIKIICKNRKAFFNFEIEDTFEVGISLLGSEVKSLRNGKANLSDSYGKFRSGELFLVDAHISSYEQANRQNHDPLRERKLLLHKRELKKLVGKVTERGYSLVPLKMYFKRGKVKIEMALARGKKTFDKREAIKKKDQRRELERMIKFRQRSS